MTDNQSPTGLQDSTIVSQEVVAAAPEPGSLALLGAGIIMLALLRRQRPDNPRCETRRR